MDVRHLAATTPLTPPPATQRPAALDISISDRGVEQAPARSQQQAAPGPETPRVASDPRAQALLTSDEARALESEFAFLQRAEQAQSGNPGVYNGRGVRASMGATQEARGGLLDLVG